MFPITTFSPLYTLTQIIKNKNLPFVKTKNRNVLNVQIKNSWTQFLPWEIIFVILYVYVLTRTKNTTLKSTKDMKKTLKNKKNMKKIQ